MAPAAGKVDRRQRVPPCCCCGNTRLWHFTGVSRMRPSSPVECPAFCTALWLVFSTAIGQE
jgi:hypothetical protein